MNYQFEKWWRDFGRYEDSVNLKNEKIQKKFAEKVWKEAFNNYYNEKSLERPDTHVRGWD